MDNPDSSKSKPLAEVHLDVRSEGTTSDKASQDSLKPTLLEVNPRFMNQLKNKEVHVEVSSDGMITDKASQEGRTPTLFEVYLRITNRSSTKEVHVDARSEGTTIDKTSQDGCRSTEGRPKVAENSRELFHAALKGNWKIVQKNLRHAGQAITAAMTAPVMTKKGQPVTVLDVAIQAAQDKLVEKLIKRLPLGNNDDFNNDDFKKVLINAARRGRIKMVKAIIDKVEVPPDTVCAALAYATAFAPLEKEVIRYLAERTSRPPDYSAMNNLISAGHMDIALYLARQFHGLASSTHGKDNTETSLLGHLATMKSYFHSGARLNFWEHCVYNCIPLSLAKTSFDKFKGKNMTPASFFKRISELKWRHHCSFEFAKLALAKNEGCMNSLETFIPGIILDAASCGIYEIVHLCLQQFPELMWDEKFTLELITKVVKGRHIKLFRLLSVPDTHPVFDEGIDRKDKLMDAVTEWSPGCVPADVSGAAFLMQRELQWFKALEGRSHRYFESQDLPSNLPTEKTSTKTHWENFVGKHQDLHKEAAQWMKDTSSSCSIVATLIITVAFSAAFAVPGGNDGNTGIPIFIKKGSFMVFAIANALALFFSVTSTLMFLAILISRYAVEDFLGSLPRKMVLGLTFLFLSLASMLVAFGSALTIILSERWKWIYIPITLLALLPAALFLILQLPLYVVMVKSTFCPSLNRPLKLWE